MKLQDLIDKAMADRAAKLASRNGIADDLAALREAYDPDEVAISEKRAAKNALDAEIDLISERIADLESEKRADDAADRLAKESTPVVRKPAYDGVARTGAEKRTYSPETDRTGSLFLQDVMRNAAFGDIESRERLSRHMSEERVERAEYLNRGAVGTSAFAGLTVPQYLTDLVAPNAKAGRPLADAARKHDLPSDGMTISISKITTGTTAAAHTQNTAVTESSIDDTLLTLDVLTNENWQSVSRAAAERSTGALDVTIDDLVRGYHTLLDNRIINEASVGLTNVATSIAYTDASPTAAELYPKILAGLSAVEAALLDQSSSGSLAVMHSRRWYWMQSQVGTSWPFIGQTGIAQEQGGVNYGTLYGAGFRGLLPNGTPVVVDNNIATNLGAGTNEDEIYVVNANECHLWEDPQAPMFIRADQAGATALNIPLVVYGYFAFTFNRYSGAMQKLAGTGLVTPTFA